MNSVLSLAALIFGVSIIAAIFAYVWQARMVLRRGSTHAEKFSSESGLVFSQTSVWQGLKFGIGFAIGVTIWGLILWVLTVITFYAAAWKFIFPLMMAG